MWLSLYFHWTVQTLLGLKPPATPCQGMEVTGALLQQLAQNTAMKP